MRRFKKARSPKNRPKVGSEDTRIEMLDGEQEIMLTGRGAVLFAYLAWAIDKLPKGEQVMRRYCQYISMRGCRGGATKILDDLSRLSAENGKKWVENSYDEFVTNDADMFSYVYGPLME